MTAPSEANCIRCGVETSQFAGNPGLWPMTVWDGVKNSGKSATACLSCVDTAFWAYKPRKKKVKNPHCGNNKTGCYLESFVCDCQCCKEY